MWSSARSWVWASPVEPGSSIPSAIAMLSGDTTTLSAGSAIAVDAVSTSWPNAVTASPASVGEALDVARAGIAIALIG